VYPGNIEKVVLQIPGVIDCVAFGVPDTLFENLVALAYSAEHHISQTVLAEECRKRLPKNLWPARIKKVSSFPQLPSGKVDRLSAVRLLN
jgi:acyl-CoA synthetase (AMP-forming)/AMP-acid ligase II